MNILTNKRIAERKLKEVFPEIKVTRCSLKEEMHIKKQYDAIIFETSKVVPILTYDIKKVKRQPLLFLYSEKFKENKSKNEQEEYISFFYNEVINVLTQYADITGQEYIQNINDDIIGMGEK
jgi:hypothetical protein